MDRTSLLTHLSYFVAKFYQLNYASAGQELQVVFLPLSSPPVLSNLLHCTARLLVQPWTSIATPASHPISTRRVQTAATPPTNIPPAHAAHVQLERLQLALQPEIPSENSSFTIEFHYSPILLDDTTFPGYYYPIHKRLALRSHIQTITRALQSLEQQPFQDTTSSLPRSCNPTRSIVVDTQQI